MRRRWRRDHGIPKRNAVLLRIKIREDLIQGILVAGEMRVEGLELPSAIHHSTVAREGIELLLSKGAPVEVERTVVQIGGQTLSPGKGVQVVIGRHAIGERSAVGLRLGLRDLRDTKPGGKVLVGAQVLHHRRVLLRRLER